MYCVTIAWHKNPWPFVSKVGAQVFFDSFEFISTKNSKNLIFIRDMATKTFLFGHIEQVPSDYMYFVTTSCEQKHFYWTKLIRFCHFVCIVLKWHDTEAPWLFTSKVVARVFFTVLSVLQLCVPKILKTDFLSTSCEQIHL